MNWLNNPYTNNFGWGSMQNGGGGNPYDTSAQSSPQALASSYNDWSRMNGGNTAANQAMANNWMTGQGVSPGQINQGFGMYQAGMNNLRTNPTLWNQLTPGSSLQDVASAYSRWSAQNGGDTAANQQTAQNYLTGMGFAPNQINQAYGMYQGMGMNNAPTYSPTQQATASGMRPAVDQIHRNPNRNFMANNLSVPGPQPMGAVDQARMGLLKTEATPIDQNYDPVFRVAPAGTPRRPEGQKSWQSGLLSSLRDRYGRR